MRFFRRIRKNYISNGRFRKYLMYSFGEIALVVIGILIALGVNSRYENHKKQLETNRTAQIVLAQIENDYSEIQGILYEWDKIDLVMDTILDHTPKGLPIPDSCIDCFSVLNGVQFPSLSERVLSLISRNSLLEGELESKLYEIELTYQEAIKGSKMYEEEIFKQLTENFNFWKSNYKWFPEYLNDGNCTNNACLEYFQSSMDYRNRVAYFRFITLEAYYGSLYDFMKTLKNYKEDLESII